MLYPSLSLRSFARPLSSASLGLAGCKLRPQRREGPALRRQMLQGLRKSLTTEDPGSSPGSWSQTPVTCSRVRTDNPKHQLDTCKYYTLSEIINNIYIYTSADIRHLSRGLFASLMLSAQDVKGHGGQSQNGIGRQALFLILSTDVVFCRMPVCTHMFLFPRAEPCAKGCNTCLHQFNS